MTTTPIPTTQSAPVDDALGLQVKAARREAQELADEILGELVATAAGGWSPNLDDRLDSGETLRDALGRWSELRNVLDRWSELQDAAK